MYWCIAQAQVMALELFMAIHCAQRVRSKSRVMTFKCHTWEIYVAVRSRVFPTFTFLFFYSCCFHSSCFYFVLWEKTTRGTQGRKNDTCKIQLIVTRGSWMGVRIVSRCLPYSSTDFPSILALIFLLPSDKNVGGQRSNGCPKKRDKIRGFCDLRTSK